MWEENCSNGSPASSRRGRASRPACSGLLLLLSLLAGCSAQYSARTVESPVALQWPYMPAHAKVSYLHSLFGFGKSGGAGTVLKAIAGSTSRDNDTFLLPVSVATGSDGRIAVADLGRRCVHLYLPAGKRYFRLSSAGETRMVSPVNVIFDEEFRLYVSDSTGRILIYDSRGEFLTSWKRFGPYDLKRPTGLAFNPARRLLYVADTLEARIYAVDTAGNLEFQFGQRGTEPGSFNYPTHIFWSSDRRLYVTDSLNFRIQIFDEGGSFVQAFGSHGDGSGDLAMPKGIAVDRDGVIFVVDALFDNVQLFRPDGEFLLSLGERGTESGEFWLPSGIFANQNNELYVCDTYNRRVQVFRITEQYE